jgi:hypothetical protein
MGNSGKLYVKPEFRKNALSDVDTETRVEVHTTNETTKVYNNIHYPQAFARKVFNESSSCTHIEVIAPAGNYTINRPE